MSAITSLCGATHRAGDPLCQARAGGQEGSTPGVLHRQTQRLPLLGVSSLLL